MQSPRTPRGVRYVKYVAPLFLALGCTGFVAQSTPVAFPYEFTDRAMLPRDHQGLAVSQTVARQVLRLMERGTRDQREPAACVHSYRIWYRTADSARMVDIYALTLAETDSSDALTIWSKTSGICPEGVPSLHGHIWRGEVLSQPSGIDSATLERTMAPFNLLAFRVTDDSTFGIRLFWRASMRDR